MWLSLWESDAVLFEGTFCRSLFPKKSRKGVLVDSKEHEKRQLACVFRERVYVSLVLGGVTESEVGWCRRVSESAVKLRNALAASRTCDHERVIGGVTKSEV